MTVEPYFALLEELTHRLRSGDLAGCESVAVESLLALPFSPFHVVAELGITNDPADVAAHFAKFFRFESERFQIESVYFEMNEFDINPGRWYFDLFAFDTDGGLEDFDWLSDWQSEYYQDYTITGLERLQDVYASNAFGDPAFQNSRDFATLVVVTKFQRLIQQCALETSVRHVPLYATAHDFDLIARILPETELS